MYNADAPELPTGPTHILLDAAVGLFDVSGFSTIADRLEKEEANAGSTVSMVFASSSKAKKKPRAVPSGAFVR